MSSPVAFAKGFQRPSSRKVRLALGLPAASVDRVYSEGQDFFRPVPSPTCEDDWLAQYNEEGQTFGQFLKQCPWLSRRVRRGMPKPFVSSGQTLKEKFPEGKIYLLPLGDFDEESRSSCSFETLSEYTRCFFGDVSVRTLPAVQLHVEDGSVFWQDSSTTTGSESDAHGSNGLPPPAKRRRVREKRFRLTSRFQPRVTLAEDCEHSAHFQLQVDTVLERLRRCMPDDAICLVALTMADLYETKADLFVAGMAGVEHRVAVSKKCSASRKQAHTSTLSYGETSY